MAKTYQLAGIIATNTTIRRDGLKTQVINQTGKSPQEEAGGISGEPLRDRSTEVIRFIWQQTQGEIPIIGVGGIFSPEDAWEKITAGASLIQVYTGWIYERPTDGTPDSSRIAFQARTKRIKFHQRSCGLRSQKIKSQTFKVLTFAFCLLTFAFLFLLYWEKLFSFFRV